MTVEELLNRISSKELTEWIIFAGVEPFGINAHYLGHAVTAQTIANTFRKKGTKAYELSEFIPKFEQKEQSVDGMLEFAEMLTVAMGGKDLRDG